MSYRPPIEITYCGCRGPDDAADDHRWRFTGATPLPDLRVGGELLLDALASALAAAP